MGVVVHHGNRFIACTPNYPPTRPTAHQNSDHSTTPVATRSGLHRGERAIIRTPRPGPSVISYLMQQTIYLPIVQHETSMTSGEGRVVTSSQESASAATLPPAIKRLAELARNLWWTWRPDAQELYALIDPAGWETYNHNAVAVLRGASRRHLNDLARDAGYIARYQEVMAAFDTYMHPAATWFTTTYPGDTGIIAYFCMEFGFHESLPIYSGGLGVLAGDHCKSASDLGLPFVGVGLWYPEGYFRQRIDAGGTQFVHPSRLTVAMSRCCRQAAMVAS